MASSRHGIESSPKSPSTHIYANSSPEFGDHNGNNIIKWPRAHIYANSSPEFGDHNGSNTIFCDPPRVGEGEDFDTIDPLTVTHKELTRTHSTNNKRFADERVGGGSLLKESTVKLETVVGLQSTNCSSDNNSLYSKNHDNYKVVLSVDGGGVRGIMPAMILKNVHDKLGENFKFDLMGGTSVGALVVTAFALGKIDRFINDYNAVAKKIFTRNWSRCNPLNWFSITRGLLGTSYRSDSKEQAIRDFVEQKEEDAYSFDAIKTRMMFPFYLQQNGTVAYYRNFDEISNPNKHKYSLINSLMSTTAAPTFFNPHVFNGLDGCRYEGIDGGVFANNPAFVSYNEARQLFSKSRIILLSLGTGDHHYMDPNLASTDRGNLFWAKKYPTITNAAMASHTHESLTQKAIDGKLDYYRINPHLLPHLCNSMDDTSPTYISTLKAYVNRAIAHSKDLHNFVEKVREVKNIES
ncbi:hypothetical protein FACS1894122_02040 [Alphaproteobacteria bacterium]|nr:hypothetical protein FACS1894122_02040 [Alphaproteobacteria bacterium]